MKTFYMKRSEKIGMKILDGIFAIPFFTVGITLLFICFKVVDEISVKIIFTPIALVPLFIGTVILFRALRKIDNKIVCCGEELHLFLEETNIVNIMNIVAFSSSEKNLSNYKQTIIIPYIRIITNDGKYYDLLKSGYSENDMKELFEYCLNFNPNIEDDYFKFIKFGEIQRDGTPPYLDRNNC